MITDGYEYDYWYGVKTATVGLYILYEAGYLAFFVGFACNTFHLASAYSEDADGEPDFWTVLCVFGFAALIPLEVIAQIVCWILQGALSYDSMIVSNMVFDIGHIVLFFICVCHLLNVGCRSYFSYSIKARNIAMLSFPSLLFFVFHTVYAILDIIQVHLGTYFIWFSLILFVCEAIPALCLFYDFFEFRDGCDSSCHTKTSLIQA